MRLAAPWGAIVSSAVCMTGCWTSGVPPWVMHVRPAPVELGASTGGVASRLAGELEWEGLGVPDGHLAPEQIAAVGLTEIEQGHVTDAALWLSIASYRYHQETMQIVKRLKQSSFRAPEGVAPAAFFRLVDEELKIYGRFSFLPALNELSDRAYGRSEVDKALQAQVMALGETSEIDRESLRDSIAELRPGTGLPAAPSRYPALLALYQRRLLNDFAADPKDEHPNLYLARTPIAALQSRALLTSTTYFQPVTCRWLAEAFPLERPDVAARLAHDDWRVRANAAATLALAPAEETRAALQARLAVEPDARVKLVLAFALVHHGVAEQAIAVTGALQSCRGPACTLPMMLTQWLPAASKADLDQATLARIVEGNQYEPKAHAFAAAALRDLGRQKPLEPATVEALIAACRRKIPAEERTLEIAFQALGDAVALSRADVLARLERSDRAANIDERFPGPLLARLAKISTVEDLPLLGRMMARFGDVGGPEADVVLEGIANVAGPEADARLGNMFIQYPNARLQIALALLARPSFPREQIARLAVRYGDARVHIIVKALLKAPDAQATLLAYLRNGKIQEQLMAATLAGLMGETSAREDLVRLSTFHDDHFYPDDALLRHAAMTSLVRLALLASRPPAAAPRPGQA